MKIVEFTQKLIFKSMCLWIYFVQVTILQLSKQMKGILLNSGIFLLQDILEHKESNYTTL